MNNAFILEEPLSEAVPKNSDERVRLEKMIEALATIIESKEWQVLHDLHFSQEKQRIERLLIAEAQKDEVSTERLYRLQGEYIWAKRYSDFVSWAKNLKNQLTKIDNG